MAQKNLWRRKVRTLLTVFVIIGTAAIVQYLLVLNNETQTADANGSLTVINVDTYYRPELTAAGSSSSYSFSRRQQNSNSGRQSVEAIKSIEGVVAVTPMLSTSADFIPVNMRHMFK